VIHNDVTDDDTDGFTDVITAGQDGIICGYNSDSCKCTTKQQNKVTTSNK